MTRWPRSATAPTASRITCWPAVVIAFATAGRERGRAGAPGTPEEDVLVEAGARVEHEPAHDARPGALRRAHRGRDPPARAQRPQVERVDGRDRRADAVELHPGREAPLDRQLDEPRALQDLEHQAR